jgi:putative tryptophan/tyrosine transport system substrate-binding protein
MGRVVRRQFLIAAGVLFAAPLTADAQQTRRQYRVGYLTTSDPSAGDHLRGAFRRGLSELGWIEGQNIAIEYRWAEGKFERLPGLAADLARLKVDVIVVTTTQPALAAKKATRTIPIITVVVSDPVATGLVTSLARPDGNITGLTFVTGAEMGGKLLELFKRTVPQASRITALWNPTNPMHALLLREAENGARKLHVQLQPIAVRDLDALEGAFAAIARERPDALLIVPDTLFFNFRRRLIDFAAKNSLPAMYGWREPVEDGGLMAYGPDMVDLFHRAAIYVDKILKGAKPADLPIQRPTKFEFVINLKTARALGLTIPPSVLLSASQVIE